MSDSTIGKEAEAKIKQWLNRPEDGYSFDRIPDQLGGFYGGRNICDFTCYKSHYLYYIESKATWSDRFDFTALSEVQYHGLLSKSQIAGVFGIVIVLFATYQRAFILDIREIDKLKQTGVKSINIKKLDKWNMKFVEIGTQANSRKKLLDYVGELDEYVKAFI